MGRPLALDANGNVQERKDGARRRKPHRILSETTGISAGLIRQIGNQCSLLKSVMVSFWLLFKIGWLAVLAALWEEVIDANADNAIA